MPETYTAIADLYDSIGMAEFARYIMPQVLDYAFRNDWLGRSIVDLGCGTGEASLWMAEAGNYNVMGVDQSEAMLALAQEKSSRGDDNVQWLTGDIRQRVADIQNAEMVVAFDVLNEMDTLKDYQAIFTHAFDMLRDDKLFAFDVHTIEGLTKRGESGEQIIHDDPKTLVVARNQYDYERQTSVVNYSSFSVDDTGQWQRRDVARALRAFPIQAVVALLKRVGFNDIKLLNEAMQPIGTRWGSLNRVVVAAWKRETA